MTARTNPTISPRSRSLKWSTTARSVIKARKPIIGRTIQAVRRAAHATTTPLTSLRVTMAGPTLDYSGPQPTQYTIQGNGPKGTLVAEPGGYQYTLPAAIAVNATGTYAFGMEGSITPVPGGSSYFALNPVA